MSCMHVKSSSSAFFFHMLWAIELSDCVRKGLVDDTKVHLTVYIPIDGRYTLDPLLTWHTKVGSYRLLHDTL